MLCAANAGAAGEQSLNGNAETPVAKDASAPAENSPVANWWGGERATGDWGGFRTRLENAGINFFLSYEQDFAGNPYGGIDQGATNSGSIEFGVLLDLQKLLKLDDTTLLVRVVDRNGSDLSSKYIGNFFPVQQDFGCETVMLQSIALEKKFF